MYKFKSENRNHYIAKAIGVKEFCYKEDVNYPKRPQMEDGNFCQLKIQTILLLMTFSKMEDQLFLAFSMVTGENLLWNMQPKYSEK